MQQKRLDWESFIDVSLYVFTIALLFLYEGKNSFLYVLACILLGVIFVARTIQRRKLLFDKKVIWLIAFTLLATASYFWATDRKNVLDVLPILLANEFIAYAFMNFIHDRPARLELLMRAIIIGSILLGLRAAIEFGPTAFFSKRMLNTLGANDLGLYAAIGANFCLYFWLKYREKKQIPLAILCILVVVMSFSRKALIFLALPAALILIFYKRNNIKKILLRIGIIIGIIALAIGSIFVIPPLRNTFGQGIEAVVNGVFDTGKKTDASVHARMKFIEYGTDMFLERPIQGFGLNNFKNLIAVRKTKGMTNVYAHNNYIEIAVDLGIIGLVVYYSLYVYMIVYGLKRFKKLNLNQLAMLSILVTLAICEYGVVSYYGDFYHILIAFTWMSLIYVSDNLDLVPPTHKTRKKLSNV